MRPRGRLITALIALTALTGLTLAALVVVPHLRAGTVLTASLAALARNDVGDADLDPLSSASRTTYLVVGTDQRHVPVGKRRDIRSERADAITLWSVGADRSAIVLSIPRDLRVHVPGHGDGKLGGALEYGQATFVEAVRSLTGAPVHHYVELEFSALSSAVDRVGGLRVGLAAPARDLASHLALPSGAQTLRGADALAFVRSRQYEELVAGQWVKDPSGDIGRIGRQHVLIAHLPDVLRRCGGLQCVALLADLGSGVTLDQAFTTRDLRLLASALTGPDARVTTAVLPTRPERPPDDAWSPFPPVHLGTVGYRQVDHAAARVVLDRVTGSAPLEARVRP